MLVWWLILNYFSTNSNLTKRLDSFRNYQKCHHHLIFINVGPEKKKIKERITKKIIIQIDHLSTFPDA